MGDVTAKWGQQLTDVYGVHPELLDLNDYNFVKRLRQTDGIEYKHELNANQIWYWYSMTPARMVFNKRKNGKKGLYCTLPI